MFTNSKREEEVRNEEDDSERNKSTDPTKRVVKKLSKMFSKSNSKNIPEEKRDEDEDDVQDASSHLADNTVVAKKLLELGEIFAKRRSDGNIIKMSPYVLVACLAAANHIYAAIQVADPELRNKLYDDCNTEKLKDDELMNVQYWLKYADWAYESNYDKLSKKLIKKGFTLMRHDKSSAAGRVAHYIAFCPKRKIGLISLKGTSTVADVLTDALGMTVEKDLRYKFHSKSQSEKVTCHEGIYTAATRMADDTIDIVEHLFMPLKYQIIICGHSLGAGTACLLGLILRERIPTMRDSYPLHVYAYAPPPVLNHQACLECVPFITSIVNNADMVTRMSMNNVAALDLFLGKVKTILKEKKMMPTNLGGAIQFTKQMKSTNDSDKLLMTPKEIDELFHSAINDDNVDDSSNIYVPGRVICLYQKGTVKKNQDKDEKIVGVTVSDGGMKVLRAIAPSETCVTDHFVTSYQDNIDLLLSQSSIDETKKNNFFDFFS